MSDFKRVSEQLMSNLSRSNYACAVIGCTNLGCRFTSTPVFSSYVKLVCFAKNNQDIPSRWLSDSPHGKIKMSEVFPSWCPIPPITRLFALRVHYNRGELSL